MNPFRPGDHARLATTHPTREPEHVKEVSEDKVALGDWGEATWYPATDLALVSRPESWMRSQEFLAELRANRRTTRHGWHGSREDLEAAVLNLRLLSAFALDYAAELEALDEPPVCQTLVRSAVA